PERVDPEQVGVLGVAAGQVAGDTLVEAELVEQAEGRGHPLLEVGAGFFRRRVLGETVGAAGSHGALRGRRSTRPVYEMGVPGAAGPATAGLQISSHSCRSSLSGSSTT